MFTSSPYRRNLRTSADHPSLSRLSAWCIANIRSLRLLCICSRLLLEICFVQLLLNTRKTAIDGCLSPGAVGTCSIIHPRTNRNTLSERTVSCLAGSARVFSGMHMLALGLDHKGFCLNGLASCGILVHTLIRFCLIVSNFVLECLSESRLALVCHRLQQSELSGSHGRKIDCHFSSWRHLE